MSSASPRPPSRTVASGVVTVTRTTVAAVRDENVTLLAAGVAYYAFVSLVPLLLLVLAVASVLGGPTLVERVVTTTDQFLTEEAQGLVLDTSTASAAAGGATVVGLSVLTWSSLKVFRGLDKAFSEVYGGTETGGLVGEVRDGVVVLLSMTVGVAVVAVAGGSVTQLFGLGRVALLAPLLSTLTLVVAFLPLYYVFPDTPVEVREVLPGTVFAAVGWSILGAVFGLYAAVAGGSVYGVLGAVLLVVTWLYLGALIVMVGAVVNATLAGTGVAVPGPTDGDGTTDRQVQLGGPRRPTTAMADEGDEVEPESESGRESGRDIGEVADGDGPTAGDSDQEMTGDDREGTNGDADGADLGSMDAETAETVDALRTDVTRLREQLDEVDDRLEERTVSRSALESDLQQYVRSRVRRGHARGWGPYLVLLYGTAMTLGAFFYLEGLWAITAMVVIWLSTLGLYALMVLVGMGLGGLAALGKLRDIVGSLRR